MTIRPEERVVTENGFDSSERTLALGGQLGCVAETSSNGNMGGNMNGGNGGNGGSGGSGGSGGNGGDMNGGNNDAAGWPCLRRFQQVLQLSGLPLWRRARYLLIVRSALWTFRFVRLLSSCRKTKSIVTRVG